MPEAVIVDAVRSPIGRAFKGSLISIRPDDLGAFVVDALLDRNPGVDPAIVDDLICGCGMPQGEQAYNIGRVISLLSRLPQHVTGATISRYCASSLNAISIAANQIKSGDADVVIAAGVEHVTRTGPNSEGTLPETQNPKLNGEDGRTNVYISMGETAENVAERYDVSRDDMDRYAQRSQERAVAAQEAGVFEREIVPIELPDGTTASKDDGPRPSSTFEKLQQLEPAFRENGRVTAGNACPLNDGAAAVLLMSDTKAEELGLKPRARIIATATSGLEPEIMGVAPIGAVKNVLERTGMTMDDIDVVELNEAFAAQVLPIAEECGIDMDNLNPHGGAIALGHPFGMTGARMMTTLLNDLETLDKQFGIETMCVAGGQGLATVVERLN